MTEPVAYKIEDVSETLGWRYSTLKPINKNYVPLYTSEQLHPRVKMTQEQHRQFENYKTNKDSFYHFWQSVLADGVSLFKNISERDLMLAWLDEKTIEIVPTVKWFVRSKKQYQPDMDQGISESGYLYLTQGDIYSVEYHKMTSFKDDATQFDNEDEAKLWTTPDTEAVQLPVEGE